MPAGVDLPPTLATLADVVLGLARQAPSARIAIVRAGELLEPDAIEPALRERLETETAAARDALLSPLPVADVERVLREAWRSPPARVLDDLDPEPLAVRPASQVHRGELDGEPVAVKVRRPGVERTVRADLTLLEAVAAPLRAAFPNLDALGVLRDVREQALDELDFEHEASQQRRIARAVRGLDGITVPRAHLEHSTAEVLVTDLLDGTTLADGARPSDPAAAVHALVATFRTAALDAGLTPVDPRPSHVVVAPDGTLGLLGLGVARPVDRDRARRAIDALGAVAGDEPGAFAEIVAGAGLLGEVEARRAHEVLRGVLGSLVVGPARLDATAVRALTDRALDAAPELARLAVVAAPQAEDLALGRMLGQLVGVLARFRATADWPAVAAGR